MLAYSLLLTSLLVQTIPPAPDEVEALIRRGGELRKAGKDAAALPFYQRAHDRGNSPRTAAQLGLHRDRLIGPGPLDVAHSASSGPTRLRLRLLFWESE